MNYQNMLIIAAQSGFEVIEHDFKGLRKAYRIDNTIILNKNILDSEKLFILREEIANINPNAGYILNKECKLPSRFENLCKKIIYENLVPISKLLEAYEQGHRQQYEVSKYLNVTEEVIINSINHHKKIHGMKCTQFGYLISFEPNLQIIKL